MGSGITYNSRVSYRIFLLYEKKKLCGFVSKNTDATFAMCFFFLATSQYLSPEGGVGSVAFFFVLVGGGSRGFHREWGGYQSSLTEY